MRNLCLLPLCLLLSGCGKPQTHTIEVYAAASLTQSLDTLIAQYESQCQGVDVVVTYDSSGTLKRQIQEGGNCDLFVSASWVQVEPWVEQAVPLLTNQLVLVTPTSNQSVTGFDCLQNGDFTLLAIGNSDVPAGAYAMEVLDYLGISVAALEQQGKISYGSNVKEVVTQAEEAMVDCAIVYATDCTDGDVALAAVAQDDWYTPAIYPMVSFSQETHVTDFATFLQSEDGKEVFTAAGFGVIES